MNSQQALETVRAAHLFGIASSSPSPVARSLTPLNLKLSGVFAASGKQPALAIINVEQKGDAPFWVGDAVLPEVTLEQVNPDHIVLNRGGVMEKLRLEQKMQALIIQSTAVQLNVRQSGKGKYSFSRNEFDKVLSDPSQLAKAGRVKTLPGEGVRVEEAASGSLMSKLGLRNGDVIRTINGKLVDKLADILQGYREEDHILLQGKRNNQTFEYNYTVN